MDATRDCCVKHQHLMDIKHRQLYMKTPTMSQTIREKQNQIADHCKEVLRELVTWQPNRKEDLGDRAYFFFKRTWTWKLSAGHTRLEKCREQLLLDDNMRWTQWLESRTLGQEDWWSHPCAAVSKSWLFRSIHVASVHSTLWMSKWDT